MLEDFKKILNFAIYAPSGENCQPWEFSIKENKILIFNLPERDQSLYSWGQRSSFLAHGALIENIIIASKELGYQSIVNLFPDQQNKNFVASIELQKTNIDKDPLFSFIDKRCTNRKHYQTNAL